MLKRARNLINYEQQDSFQSSSFRPRQNSQPWWGLGIPSSCRGWRTAPSPFPGWGRGRASCWSWQNSDWCPRMFYSWSLAGRCEDRRTLRCKQPRTPGRQTSAASPAGTEAGGTVSEVSPHTYRCHIQVSLRRLSIMCWWFQCSVLC